MKNHYTILGIDQSANLKDIEKAYRREALSYHPDKGGDVKRFREIKEAYELLSDTSKRGPYDIELNDYERGGSIEPSDTVPFNNFEDDPEGKKLVCRCGGEYFVATSELEDVQGDNVDFVVACDTCSLLISVTF
eukprot:TRINITY_DN6329_c0_g1_i1.p1 TRINITY_DN6329_c0_g1~~TRINITY_DN6329_c0_g1_i1.p1  ORF type:complete len:147 (+),score=40.71 TRINITY_DN6329_c0_g1_i1:40-441(+)